MIKLPDEHGEHQLPKLPNSVTAQDMKESLNIPMFQEEAECAASAFNQCLMECQPVYDAAKRIKGALDECLKEIDAMQENINYKYKTLIEWRKRAIELETEVQRLNATAQPVSDGWVKCSERMPESDGQYWGWWSEDNRQGPVWFSEHQSQFQSYQITHWMPLPAAPGGQGD